MLMSPVIFYSISVRSSEGDFFLDTGELRSADCVMERLWKRLSFWINLYFRNKEQSNGALSSIRWKKSSLYPPPSIKSDTPKLTGCPPESCLVLVFTLMPKLGLSCQWWLCSLSPFICRWSFQGCHTSDIHPNLVSHVALTAPYAQQVGSGKSSFLFLHPDQPFLPHKSPKRSPITSVLTSGPMSACSRTWMCRALIPLAVVLDAQTSICGTSCRESEMNLNVDWVVSWRTLQHLNAESMIMTRCFSAVSANTSHPGSGN